MNLALQPIDFAEAARFIAEPKRRVGNRTNHPQRPISVRFWERVQQTDSCWLWTGAKYGPRYGGMTINKRTVGAHRVSWELANGPVPHGLSVLHHCDVPLCVNPSHLFLGTQRDNMADCARKGRNVFQAHPERIPRGDAHGMRLHPERRARGEQHGLTTLRESDVLEIRGASGTNTSLALRFGVSRRTIRNIRSRKTWAHVP